MGALRCDERTVVASAGSTYPVNFPRLSVHELPTDNITARALCFSENAQDKRVINVSLPCLRESVADRTRHV